MHTEFDEYFKTVARLKRTDLSARERLQQLNKLSERLVDWGLDFWPNEAFDLWQQYKTFGTLPYPGCYLDQPMFIRRVFTQFTLLEQWHDLNEQLPSADGVQTLDELLNTNRATQ